MAEIFALGKNSCTFPSLQQTGNDSNIMALQESLQGYTREKFQFSFPH